MENQRQIAEKMRSIYIPPFAFPKWVLEKDLWPTFSFSDTITFHHKEDSLEKVKQLMTEREPCNIGMRRPYDKAKLQAEFGWGIGAYALSTPDSPMPNIAVYCNATVHTPAKGFFNVHVLNLVGCALDSYSQPDYVMYKTLPECQYFYSRMWRLAVRAIQRLKEIQGIQTVKVYNVGGGAFANMPEREFIETVFEPTFLPLVPELENAGIAVKGYDQFQKKFNGGYIPGILESPTEDLSTTLYINAWDPWSLIGNGNAQDGSLDGHWGRISNMSVLGWLPTNPHMSFLAV